MTQHNTGIILIGLLLAAMVIMPAVSAEKNMTGKTISATATQDQVDKINELWGTDLSVLEYYQQVHPQLLVDMPDDIREAIFLKRWNWPVSPHSSLQLGSLPWVSAASRNRFCSAGCDSPCHADSGSRPFLADLYRSC
jgi:hypothetical protein